VNGGLSIRGFLPLSPFDASPFGLRPLAAFRALAKGRSCPSSHSARARPWGASVPVAALIVTLIGIGLADQQHPGIADHDASRRSAGPSFAAAVWCAVAMGAVPRGQGHLGAFAVGRVHGRHVAGQSSAWLGRATSPRPCQRSIEQRAFVDARRRDAHRPCSSGPFIAAVAIHHYGLTGAYGRGHRRAGGGGHRRRAHT